ncbi:cytochrome P450 [Lepidopterella palustris CBS 459.81]|uniref:Cytochrome P450 n=1 Tax=Lepidopterella palustris CBS 459.81 TaxID=1314670 RepID=A0A8E2EA32_9PEZI|nr:cytochrome P450 [Lepidopterella palustris CBS 459.81]
MAVTFPFLGAFVVWIAYLIGLAIYRLWFSPIAKFPGPKLAALTSWYECYLDVFAKGQFTFNIQDMHKKYGPIVRITPDELHIKDSEYWDELYVKIQKADKSEKMSYRFGCPTNVFATTSHALHRMRRGALNPMFSKRQIVNFQPTILEKLNLFCDRIAAFKKSGEPMSLSDGFCAFTGDVVMEYAFGFCYDHIKSPGFSENMGTAFRAGNKFGHTAVQFPWIYSIMDILPANFVKAMTPDLAPMLRVHQDLGIVLQRMIKGEDNPSKSASHPTVMNEVLQSDLPPQEKTVRRLIDEAQTVLGAGVMTTAVALSSACFYIISNPKIEQKLREELYAAIPDPAEPLDWARLEKLPYLKACLWEAMRISPGTTTRLPRLANHPIKYKDWIIPARTPVSMNMNDVNFDESIFPSPYSYIPERWLNDPKAPSGQPLEHYFIAFGKGSRMCIGLNMAHAEMFVSLAAIFRRFAFELYETDMSDVTLKHDYFIPLPKLDSKGIRVIVKSDILDRS